MGLAGVERRTKEHFHLSAGRAVSVKLLKTRGKLDESRRRRERRKMAERWKKRRMKAVFATKRISASFPFCPVFYSTSLEIDP